MSTIKKKHSKKSSKLLLIAGYIIISAVVIFNLMFVIISVSDKKKLSESGTIAVATVTSRSLQHTYRSGPSYEISYKFTASDTSSIIEKNHFG